MPIEKAYRLGLALKFRIAIIGRRLATRRDCSHLMPQRAEPQVESISQTHILYHVERVAQNQYALRLNFTAQKHSTSATIPRLNVL